MANAATGAYGAETQQGALAVLDSGVTASDKEMEETLHIDDA